MKIAWCIYGQPRNFEEGYNYIKKFINNENNKNNIFDFYIHCWFDKKQINQYYHASTYRNIDKNELLIKDDTDKRIIELYKPIDFLFEENKIFTTEIFEKSLNVATTENVEKNIYSNKYSNILSNLYSKFKVNEILNNNINSSNNYDLIISTRFDYLNDFIVNLDTIDKNKLNIICLDNSRIIINDSFIISNLKIYNNYSNAFNNIEKFIDNQEIIKKCSIYSKSTEFVVENILCMNLLYYYDDNIVNIINYNNDMLNFCK